jgi:hypothetical protein
MASSPSALGLRERAPVVPILIHLGSITLTDPTGGRPPVERCSG